MLLATPAMQAAYNPVPFRLCSSRDAAVVSRLCSGRVPVLVCLCSCGSGRVAWRMRTCSTAASLHAGPRHETLFRRAGSRTLGARCACGHLHVLMGEKRGHTYAA